jgi:hypothetical protein
MVCTCRKHGRSTKRVPDWLHNLKKKHDTDCKVDGSLMYKLLTDEHQDGVRPRTGQDGLEGK